jgi:hypothetical protein
MSLFPTTPVPDTPYPTSDTFKTLTSPEYDSGLVVFKQLRNYSLYSGTLTYGQHFKWSDISSASGLYDFFMSMKGMALSFTFIDFNGHDASPVGIRWPKLYVGVGGASATSFDIPMVSSTSYTLWVNGSDQTSNLWTSGGFTGSMWKFHSAAGTDGRDQVEFATAPTSGYVIEWQATGQRTIKAHFTVDAMSFNAFTNMLVSTGLGIREVR